LDFEAETGVNMAGDLGETRKNLAQSVETSLKKVEGTVSSLRKNHNRILTTTIISSGAATLVAGLAAAFGPTMQIGTAGWRIACIFSDRLSEAKQCVGKLRYLSVVIATGSKDWAELMQEYEEIVKTFPEYV
jgi:hypothetical protein